MPGKISMLLLVCFSASICYGQVDTLVVVKRGKHKVFIKLIENSTGKKKIKGYSMAINDSGMWVTKGFYSKQNSSGELNYRLIFVEAKSIEKLYFRRKGTIGWGILTGTIAGIFIGSSIASASLEEPRKPFDGLEIMAGVIIGMESGAIIGGLTGAMIRKRFSINGDLLNFLNAKGDMTRFLPRNLIGQGAIH